jgi:hypothetical protein
MRVFVSVLAACILASHLLAAYAKNRYQYESQVFKDPWISNTKILRLKDGKVRAYFTYTASTAILSAVSEDDGKNFVMEGGQRISAGRYPAPLKLSDGRIRLYYLRKDSPEVLSAISNDGLNFTEEEGIRFSFGSALDLDSAGIMQLSAVQSPEGLVKIYYDALDKQGVFPRDLSGIMSASSANGLNFTKDPGLRISSGHGPFAEYEDGLYKLYFTSESKKPGLYLASSVDGVNFTTVNKKPVLPRNKKLGPNKIVDCALPGLPQNVSLLPVKDGKRVFYWSSGGHGTHSALLTFK